jgi:hypothetical protein
MGTMIAGNLEVSWMADLLKLGSAENHLCHHDTAQLEGTGAVILIYAMKTR